MIRRLPSLVAGAILVAGLACAGSDTTAPTRLGATTRVIADKSGNPPGSVGAPHITANGNGGLQGCTPRAPQYGTALVGPSGGELIVGPHRVIIPPGALTDTVTISGTTPADADPTIILEPTGLQFKKPAGLILDASNCTDVPDVIYINEIGVPSDSIPAIYSTWWHTVAAPINHFSGYLVAF
jgi:hypothetical protein